METVKVTMEVHENTVQTLVKHSVKQTLAVFLLEYVEWQRSEAPPPVQALLSAA